MWVNEMLTIVLWGTVASLLLIVFSLYKWYGLGRRSKGDGTEGSRSHPENEA